MPLVDAAVAVSAPLDLAAANTALSSGFNLVYAGISCARWFRRRGKGTPLPRDASTFARASSRTLREFDDAVTAPLHGFLGVDDYYARSSAGPAAGDRR
jgi:predicted alpha/beta-fold hydrolase